MELEIGTGSVVIDGKGIRGLIPRSTGAGGYVISSRFSSGSGELLLCDAGGDGCAEGGSRGLLSTQIRV